MTIQVRVKNISEVTWPASSQIKLGNHWLDDKENPLLYDDGRVSLPRDVEPGGEITLQLTVTVPTMLVPCILELDMVQEMVAWFKDGRSNTIKFRFQPEGEQFWVAQIRPRIFGDTIAKIRYLLRRKWSRARASETGSAPRIEMYCIPRDKVLNLIDSCGGKTVDVQEDTAAGLGWLDFCYYVTKP
jgi:hypothetical protein